ncbi:hypothetical protein P7C73_g6856, partial [Tremellales sp. Uapishka_1]
MSTDTIASLATSDSHASPTPSPAFKASKSELQLVKQMKTSQWRESGDRWKKKAESESLQKGMKPLQLLADKQNNRLSTGTQPLPAGLKRISLLENRAKTSAGSGATRGERKGKLTAGSGSGISGLRV